MRLKKWCWSVYPLWSFGIVKSYMVLTFYIVMSSLCRVFIFISFSSRRFQKHDKVKKKKGRREKKSDFENNNLPRRKATSTVTGKCQCHSSLMTPPTLLAEWAGGRVGGRGKWGSLMINNPPPLPPLPKYLFPSASITLFLSCPSLLFTFYPQA